MRIPAPWPFDRRSRSPYRPLAPFGWSTGPVIETGQYVDTSAPAAQNTGGGGNYSPSCFPEYRIPQDSDQVSPGASQRRP